MSKTMKTQSEILEKIAEMIEIPNHDPLGFRREALLEFTTIDSIKVLQDRFSDKIPVIPADDEWSPLLITEENIIRQIRLLCLSLNSQPNRNVSKPGILDLRAMHKLEAYSWILDDIEALEMFEQPRTFIGNEMLRYFSTRHSFELSA